MTYTLEGNCESFLTAILTLVVGCITVFLAIGFAISWFVHDISNMTRRDALIVNWAVRCPCIIVMICTILFFGK